ncbi:MAG: RluA family pseudouridine synthase [Bacteroidota bacterium]
MEIIHQEETFAIVNKPAGLAVTKNSYMQLDADYLNKQAAEVFKENIYNPHRLDAKTSGLIILCFDKETTELFNAMFRQKNIKKTYTAITKGSVPEEGQADKPVFDRKKGKKLPAVTSYKRLEQVDTGEKDKNGDDLYLNLLEIEIETGRWHQIRQHLSGFRYDIIGDTQHGDWDLNKHIREKTGLNRLFLHASGLTFAHPRDKNVVSLTAPKPICFNELLQYYK